MIRKYRYLLTAAAAVGAAGLLTFATRNDFGLGRNMEITVNMMRELSLGYVDPVDPDKLMEGAAEGMVSDLDPYTEFIPEDQMSNFELLTTGKYGGVGSLIRKKGDWVTIAQPYKGSPADRAGLKIGDKILAIFFILFQPFRKIHSVSAVISNRQFHSLKILLILPDMFFPQLFYGYPGLLLILK